MTLITSQFSNRRLTWQLCFVALGLLLASTVARADNEITPKLLPPAGNTVGAVITLTLTIRDGSIKGISLPEVSGLTLNGTGTNLPDYNFFITPTRAGDFTIPAFDIHTGDGKVIHVKAVKFHVGS